MEANSVDSLVTDPPAGISFMGKDWDDDKGGREQWIAWAAEVFRECLRVMKPGAHGLVWALPRTSHWTATALELAGFEVRDRVSHLFGTGFPKSSSLENDRTGALCRCAANRRSTSNNTHEPGAEGRSGTAAPSGDGGLPLAGDSRSTNGDEGSPVDCQPGHDSRGAQPLPIGGDDLASPPSREGAQGRSRCAERDGAPVPGQERSLSPAQRSDRLSSQDSPHGAASPTESDGGIPSSKSCLEKTGSGSGGSPDARTLSMDDFPSASLDDTTWPPLCQVCGKPAPKGWYNGGLKPACEDWWLVRKPLSERTVAANVLRWGTGALNIDGCRVGTQKMGGQTVRSSYSGEEGHFGGGKDRDRVFVATPSTGRFPSHLVLSHSPECREVGTKKVKAIEGGSRGAGGQHGKYGEIGAQPDFKPGKGDADGTETVTAWECTEGCAVAALDAQSGTTKSTIRTRGADESGDRPGGWRDGKRTPGKRTGAADAGGASRFFYCAKASRSDRGDGNSHPTVKSTALMAYLCRLVTPPGGRILDPFAGSGSTGVAALREGFEFVGIERDPVYAEIAKSRTAEVSA